MKDRGERGFESLGYAIIETAVEDVKALQEADIVVKGKCVKIWPKDPETGRPRKILGGYDKRCKVDELIHFFHSPALVQLLDLVGAQIEAHTIRQKLQV